MSYSFPMDFETTLAPGFAIGSVPGDATPLCVINENSPVGLADRAIQNTQSWSATFRWRVSGGASDLLGPTNKWNCRVFLVSVSGGTNRLREMEVPYKVSVGGDNYQGPATRIEFPAGWVADGVYKLYTSIDLITGGIEPITLFGEGPLMKFYTP